MNRIEKVGHLIAAMQDAVLEERDALVRDVDEVRNRLFCENAAYERPSRRTWRWVLGVGLTALLLIGAGTVYWVGGAASTKKPVIVAVSSAAVKQSTLVGHWVSAGGAERQLQFSDGSRVWLTGEGAGRVLADNGHQVHFLLEQGSARVDVIHHADTRWVLDVGPYQVNVVGTRFEVSWSARLQRFSLNMERGQVVVTGPMVANGREVANRESFNAYVGDGRLEILSAADSDSQVVEIGSVAGDVVNNGNVEEASQARSHPMSRKHQKIGPAKAVDSVSGADHQAARWSLIIQRGGFAEVVEKAKQVGMARVVAERPLDDLSALASAARYQKRWGLAIEALSAIRSRFTGSGAASVAAFTMGKIAIDHQRAFGIGAKWLQVYLDEGAKGSLAREALGRLVEARRHLSDKAATRQAAQNYLNRYPDGPHASVAKAALKE